MAFPDAASRLGVVNIIRSSSGAAQEAADSDADNDDGDGELSVTGDQGKGPLSKALTSINAMANTV